MNFLGKIFGQTAKEITESVSSVVDKLSTSDAEKLQAKKELTEVVMNGLNRSMELQHNVIVAEAQGGWLQRSWRPILMLSFGFVIMYRYFIAPVSGMPAIEMPQEFWTLLELGIGGYVVGRSLEKVTDTVVKNVDISFIKKKDRKS